MGLSYLVMPLAHHLLSTPPGYRYLSASTNFFAPDPGLQALVLLVAVAQAAGTVRLRSWMLAKRGLKPAESKPSNCRA